MRRVGVDKNVEGKEGWRSPGGMSVPSPVTSQRGKIIQNLAKDRRRI
jgi:hypothetical protein